MATLTQNFAQTVGVLQADYLRRAIQTADDDLLKPFPFKYTDSDQVVWDQWETNFGLMPLRGLGGVPDLVTFNGSKRYTAAPGYFGLGTLVDEGQITKGVQPGTLGDPVEVSDLLSMIALDSAAMTLNRARKSVADLWRTGKIDIQDTAGRRFQYAVENYASQILVPVIPWLSSASTADPIGDMLLFQAGLQKGTDSRFGTKSVLLANSFTIQQFFEIAAIKNTYRGDYGSTINGLETFNRELAGDGIKQGFSLPSIVRYDEGYYPTATDAINKTNFTYFIPTGTLLWAGIRPQGEQPAMFQLTRHAGLVNGGGDAAQYDAATVRNDDPTDIGKGLYVRCHYQNRQPHGFYFEAGLNGLPIELYPSAFATIQYT